MPSHCVHTLAFSNPSTTYNLEALTNSNENLETPVATFLDPACSHTISYTLVMNDLSLLPGFVTFTNSGPSVNLAPTVTDVDNYYLTLTATDSDSGLTATHGITINVILPSDCVDSISFADSEKAYQYTIGEVTTFTLDTPEITFLYTPCTPSLTYSIDMTLSFMNFDDSVPSITLSSVSYNDENTDIFTLTAEYNGTPYTQ